MRGSPPLKFCQDELSDYNINTMVVKRKSVKSFIEAIIIILKDSETTDIKIFYKKIARRRIIPTSFYFTYDSKRFGIDLYHRWDKVNYQLQFIYPIFGTQQEKRELFEAVYQKCLMRKQTTITTITKKKAIKI